MYSSVLRRRLKWISRECLTVKEGYQFVSRSLWAERKRDGGQSADRVQSEQYIVVLVQVSALVLLSQSRSARVVTAATSYLELIDENSNWVKLVVLALLFHIVVLLGGVLWVRNGWPGCRPLYARRLWCSQGRRVSDVGGGRSIVVGRGRWSRAAGVSTLCHMRHCRLEDGRGGCLQDLTWTLGADKVHGRVPAAGTTPKSQRIP